MQDDKAAAAKLKAASALYYLKTKKFKLAAMKFTEVRCWIAGRFHAVAIQAGLSANHACAWAPPCSSVQLHGQ